MINSPHEPELSPRVTTSCGEQVHFVLAVQVIMQAQREAPTSYADCKDKFLVQSCIVSEEAKDVSGDVFDKATDTKQTKLRVVLLGPPKPPSPVPEGVEEDYSPGKEVFKPDEGDQDEGGPLAGNAPGTMQLPQALQQDCLQCLRTVRLSGLMGLRFWSAFRHSCMKEFSQVLLELPDLRVMRCLSCVRIVLPIWPFVISTVHYHGKACIFHCIVHG